MKRVAHRARYSVIAVLPLFDAFVALCEGRSPLRGHAGHVIVELHAFPFESVPEADRVLLAPWTRFEVVTIEDDGALDEVLVMEGSALPRPWDDA